jgi:hypothetical protein
MNGGDRVDKCAFTSLFGEPDVGFKKKEKYATRLDSYYIKDEND